MNGCSFDLSAAYSAAEDLFYEKEILEINDLFPIFDEITTNLKDISIDSNSKDFETYLEQVRDLMLSDFLMNYQINLFDNEKFNLASFKDRFIKIHSAIETGITEKPQSAESLVNFQAEGRSAKDASDKFINIAYKTADTVRMSAVKEMRTMLFDSCFVDRGLTNLKELGDSSTTEGLNKNIRIFQQQLFDNIMDFIQTFDDIPEDIKNLNRSLYVQDERGNWTSTKVWERVFPYIKNKLNPDNYSPITLNDLYNSTESKHKVQLNAFNAYVFLSNFDSFLKSVFGDAININNFGIKNGRNKYTFADRTGNQTQNWRKDENIFIEDEADVLTKLLIETTPLLDLNGDVIKGQYLTFQDVAYVTSLLKLWATSPIMTNIDFTNGLFKKARESLNRDGLISTKTNNILILCRTFPVLIASLRMNFLKYMPAVAEVINSGMLNDTAEIKNLSKDVRRRLYTTLQSFFGPKESNSIYALNNALQEKNIYKNLCLTLDSVFKNTFTTIYLDDNGTFYNRMLSDLAEYVTRLLIQSNINVKHSPGLQTNFIENFKTKYGYLETNKSEKAITYKIPNSKIELEVNKRSEEVSIFYNDGKNRFEIKTSLDIPSSIFNEFKYIVFKLSDDLIGTNFLLDSGHFDIFASKDTETGALLKLLKYEGRILNRIYISNAVLPKLKSLSDKMNLVKSLYGNDKFKLMKFDRTRKLMNLYGGDIDEDKQIILSLAKSLVEHRGLLTSSIVNNSEGKAQSNNALSKLLGSFFTQWELQEKTSLSATRDFDLLNVSGLFVKNYITNEVYSKYDQVSKKAVAMTPAEFSQVNILMDFIPALFDIDKNRISSNGLALFIASINSDKGTVDKIEIDLTKKGRYMTNSYADADIDEIRKNIALNLGEYYSNMLDSVLNTFQQLENFIPEYLKSKKLIDPELANCKIDYIDDFSQFKLWLEDINRQNGTKFTSSEFLDDLVREHNKKYSPVELVLNIHTVFDKKWGLIASNTLLGQVYRFGYRGHNNVNLINKGNWSNIDLFFEMKERELAGSLLEDGTRLNILELPSNIVDKLLEKYTDWIDDGGNLIVCKINGKSYSTKADIGLDFKHNLLKTVGDSKVQFELNPLILKQNALHYLFTLQWMNSTVGSFVAHPIKPKTSAKSEELLAKYSWLQEMYDEASLFIAQSKRNVSFTAQMLQFLLNTLFGINNKYQIAVIKDLKHAVDVLTSKLNNTTPFDGATIASPDTVYLENYSLGGNTSGLTKKTFVHFKNAEVGNGGIIKTAVFGLSNDNMRQSPDLLLNLHYKMSSQPWKNQDGVLIDLDLTHDDLTDENITFPDLYFHKGHLRYLIVSIKKNPDKPFSYIRTIRKVTKTGEALQNTDENFKLWQNKNPLGTRELFSKVVEDYNKDISETIDNVNNNFAVWELFGGLNSMEIKGNKLVLSENSIKALVNCMNRVGIKLNDNVETLDDFYQPMKHSQIQYAVTEGAIKLGGANMNPNTTFTDDTPLMTQFILMLLAGTLLDKEHHADLAEVSLPTLIITACSALGYSFDSAENLYNGIAAIADLALKLLMDEALTSMQTRDYRRFLNSCTLIIIDNLANSSTLNFGTYLAESILQAARAANTDEFDWSKAGLPISDNTVFNRAINTICNYMTKNAIKIKMPGSLAIMTPSYKTVCIYGDRKFSDYMDPFKDIRSTLYNLYDSNPIFDINKGGSVANVNLDYNYKLTVKEAVKFESQIDGDLIIYNGVTYKIPWLDQEGNTRYKQDIKLYNNKVINFNNFENGLIFFGIYDAIREKTKKRRPRIRTESLEDYNIRINQEAFDEYEVSRKTKFQELIYHKKVTLGDDSDTDINYNTLRSQVESGVISNITEYIMNGRDLASYNVRFEGTFETVADTNNINELLELTKSDYINKLYNETSIKEAKKHYNDYDDLLSLEGQVLKHIAFYSGDKIKWSTLAKEVYRLDDTSKAGTKSKELVLLKWLTNKTDGIDFNKFVHKIYESIKEYPLFSEINDNDVKNIVIDDIKLGLNKLEYQNLFYQDAIIPLMNAENSFELEAMRLATPKDVLPEEIYNNVIQNVSKELKSDTYSIWDLASVQALHSLKSDDPKYQDAYVRMLRDILILSKSGIDLEAKWEELKNEDPKTIYDLTILIFGKELPYKLTKGNHANINKLADLYLNTITIRTPNGIRLVRINKDTVKHLDYEVVMPKIYKSVYNLEEDTCLAEVQNNPDYFTQQMIRNSASNLLSEQYCLEIKNSNGKHIYIGFEGYVNINGMTNITDNVYLMVDDEGRIFRLDEDDEPMYEIKPGMLIFADSMGNEVMILRGGLLLNGKTIDKYQQLEYYLKKNNGYNLTLSDNILGLNEEDQTKVLDIIKNSKWNKRVVLHFKEEPYSLQDYIFLQKQIYKPTELDLRDARRLRHRDWKTLTEAELNLLNSVNNSFEYINGCEKHASFLESLKIIAARIPALNMLSFMGMKVVAFSNGDRNTAYVSDTLLFLQGSDFDIDSVTLLSYDINRDGKLDLWSPYASIRNSKDIEASKKLPFPTGQELTLENKSTDVQKLKVDNNIEDLFNYLSDFIDLFNLIEIKNGKILVKLVNTRKARNADKSINLINKLLRLKEVLYYDGEISTDLITKLNEKLGVTLKNDQIKLMFDNLLKIINNHNTYLTNLDSDELRRIVNNSNLHNMYEIITDTVNLSQSMTSVDAVTDPVKALSKFSSKASEDSYMSPGNSHSIGSGININYTGKDCIAKSASSLKAYFKLTHYFNKVLNSKNPEALKLLLLDDKIIKKCGKYASLLANVRATDPSKIFNEDVLRKLVKAKTSNDAAAELSALLGLSADNAKELILAKINAGIDMIGLYLYGISIGFNIANLSKILMSPTADILHEAMSSNFLSHKKEQDIYSIFDYFQWGPVLDVDQFNQIIKDENIISEDISTPAKDVIVEIVNRAMEKWNPKRGIFYHNSSSSVIAKIYKTLERSEKIPISSFDIGHAIAELVFLFENDNNSKDKISDFIQFINSIDIPKTQTKKDYYVYNFLNFIKEFGLLKLRLDADLDNKNILHILATGSKSMQMVGSIASLNLGIPGDLTGLMNKINVIEHYVLEQFKLRYRLLLNDEYTFKNNFGQIVESKKNEFDSFKISLTEFVFDLDYRNKKIKLANDYKINFNLFHVIDILPDIKQYVNALGLVDTYMKNTSSRYDFIRSNFDNLKLDTKLTSDNLVSGMSRYIQSIYILEYLKYVTHDLGFLFPKTGLKKFNKLGLLTTSTYNDGYSGLDSVEGLALFKLWMESVVIPKLKNDYNNKFILGLTGVSRNNTISKSEMIAYSLPINMMPKKEGSNEDIVFKDYLASFNNFNGVYNINGKLVPAKDLLFYYTLVAFEWKPSQNSLMQIFKSDILLLGSKVKEYFNFISKMEQINQFILSEAYDSGLFLAGNINDSYGSKFIYELNDNTGIKELWQKTKSKNISYNLMYTFDDTMGAETDADAEVYDLYDNIDAEDFVDADGNPIDTNTNKSKSKYKLSKYTRVSYADPNYFPFGAAKNKSNNPIDALEELRKKERFERCVYKDGVFTYYQNNIIFDPDNENVLFSINYKEGTITIPGNYKDKKKIVKDLKNSFIKIDSETGFPTLDPDEVDDYLNKERIENCPIK